MKPFRSAGGDIVRGDADDGDIELLFCGITVLVSKLFETDFGECISLGRSVQRSNQITWNRQ